MAAVESASPIAPDSKPDFAVGGHDFNIDFVSVHFWPGFIKEKRTDSAGRNITPSADRERARAICGAAHDFGAAVVSRMHGEADEAVTLPYVAGQQWTASKRMHVAL